MSAATQTTKSSKTTKVAPVSDAAWEKVISTYSDRIKTLRSKAEQGTSRIVAEQVKVQGFLRRIVLELDTFSKVWEKQGLTSAAFLTLASELTGWDESTVSSRLKSAAVLRILPPEHQGIPSHEAETLAKVMLKHGSDGASKVGAILTEQYAKFPAGAPNAARDRKVAIQDAARAAVTEQESPADKLKRASAAKARERAAAEDTAKQVRTHFNSLVQAVETATTDAKKSVALGNLLAWAAYGRVPSGKKKGTSYRNLPDALRILSAERYGVAK